MWKKILNNWDRRVLLALLRGNYMTGKELKEIYPAYRMSIKKCRENGLDILYQFENSSYIIAKISRSAYDKLGFDHRDLGPTFGHDTILEMKESIENLKHTVCSITSKKYIASSLIAWIIVGFMIYFIIT